jgi:alpha-glucosidase
MLHALLGSVRGSICLYQGEELGLGEAELCFEQLQDPYGITFWPNFKGRDGCRTPLPWDNTGTYAGFSDAEPWLPVVEEHKDMAISTQLINSHSPLAHCQSFLNWRKQQDVLLYGDITFTQSDERILAFKRTYNGKQFVCYFNLSDQAQAIDANGSVVISNEYNGSELNAYGYAIVQTDSN